jgi:GAF domain-containing protein
VRTALRVVHGLARPRAVQPLGAGVIAQVARTGERVRVDVYDPACSPLAALDDLVGDAGPAGSVLAVPLRVATRLVGVLGVHAARPGAFGPEDEELLGTLATHAATAIANAQLYAESEAERRQSEALVEVARAVSGSLRLGEVLRLVLRHAMGLLRAEGAVVALERDAWLHVVAGVGCVEVMAGAHLPADAGLLGRALVADEPVIANAVSAAELHPPIADLARIDQVTIVPLATAQGRIGVLAVVNRGSDFGPADARVLVRLAEQVALAILNARLFEAVETATREWKVAFDAITSGMAVLDADGRVTRCNARAAELLLGHATPRAALGAPFVAALTGEPEPSTRVVLADERPGDAAPLPGGELGALLGRVLRHGGPARQVVHAAERAFDVSVAPHPAGGGGDVRRRERAAHPRRSPSRVGGPLHPARRGGVGRDPHLRRAWSGHERQRRLRARRSAPEGAADRDAVRAARRPARSRRGRGARGRGARGARVRRELRWRDPRGCERSRIGHHRAGRRGRRRGTGRTRRRARRHRGAPARHAPRRTRAAGAMGSWWVASRTSSTIRSPAFSR